MNNEENLDNKQTQQLNIGGVSCWVSCSDKLPIPYSPVLVCFKNEWTAAIRTANWVGDSWMIHDIEPIHSSEITHWMKVPKPPCS